MTLEHPLAIVADFRQWPSRRHGPGHPEHAPWRQAPGQSVSAEGMRCSGRPDELGPLSRPVLGGDQRTGHVADAHGAGSLGPASIERRRPELDVDMLLRAVHELEYPPRPRRRFQLVHGMLGSKSNPPGSPSGRTTRTSPRCSLMKARAPAMEVKRGA